MMFCSFFTTNKNVIHEEIEGTLKSANPGHLRSNLLVEKRMN